MVYKIDEDLIRQFLLERNITLYSESKKYIGSIVTYFFEKNKVDQVAKLFNAKYLLSCYNINTIFENILWIDNIIVEKKMRNNSYGTHLLEKAISFTPENEKTLCILRVLDYEENNANLNKFYFKNGFISMQDNIMWKLI